MRVLRRRQMTDFEVKMLKEMRVDTKLGVISALQRKLKDIQVADNAPPHEAVFQPGCLRWSYNVVMDRFQLLVLAIHKHFCVNPAITGHRAVTFSPSFELLDSDTGFSSAQIHFRSVMDFLSFFGIRSTSTIANLIWTPYDARGGKYLRLLGGVHTDCTGNTQSLNMTVGYSCTEEAVPHERAAAEGPDFAATTRDIAHADLNAPDNSARTDDGAGAYPRPSTRTASAALAYSFRIEDVAWDSENGRFANQPLLVQINSGFRAGHNCGDASFCVTWKSEAPRTQRQLDPDAVDREGVRRGTMVVQLPYYIVGPQLASQLLEACDTAKLESIIAEAL